MVVKRCNFDATVAKIWKMQSFVNFWFAKNWKISLFAPPKRPGSYLNNKKSAMEDHKRIFEKKVLVSFRIRKMKSKFTENTYWKFTSIFINHFLGWYIRAAEVRGQKAFSGLAHVNHTSDFVMVSHRIAWAMWNGSRNGRLFWTGVNIPMHLNSLFSHVV